MLSAYCVHCRDERELRINSKEEIFEVKGEPIVTKTQVAVCTECGQEIFVEELDEANLKKAYDEYRAGHGMLTAGEVRAIRDDYDLTQSELAELLGWGRVTISRYENGAIQSRGHDQALKLLRNVDHIHQLLEEGERNLSEVLRKKLETYLGDGEYRKEGHSVRACVSALLDSGEPNLQNGFRRFSLEAAHQAASYLAANVQHFFQSKATKLLWYADFLAYKSQARSITGCAYVAAPYGPVPDRYTFLFDEMVESGVLTPEEVQFRSWDGEDFTKEIYVPSAEIDTGNLSALEVECLSVVAREFADLSSNKTIERAHAEPAYQEVYEPGEKWRTIPYDLASTLSLEAIPQ